MIGRSWLFASEILEKIILTPNRGYINKMSESFILKWFTFCCSKLCFETQSTPLSVVKCLFHILLHSMLRSYFIYIQIFKLNYFIKAYHVKASALVTLIFLFFKSFNFLSFSTASILTSMEQERTSHESFYEFIEFIISICTMDVDRNLSHVSIDTYFPLELTIMSNGNGIINADTSYESSFIQIILHSRNFSSIEITILNFIMMKF